MKSAVAGILSADGGLRTVIDKLWEMHHHVQEGERLFVIPGYRVQEPVPWDDIPALIQRVHRYVIEQTSPVNLCGSCQQCCIVPYIDDPKLKKPSHTVCQHCDSQVGCFIHFNKPKACQSFVCDWLKSQDGNRPMEPELRPDRCGVFFTGAEPGDDDDLFYVHPDPRRPDGLSNEHVLAYIDREQAEGRKARLVTEYKGETWPK